MFGFGKPNLDKLLGKYDLKGLLKATNHSNKDIRIKATKYALNVASPDDANVSMVIKNNLSLDEIFEVWLDISIFNDARFKNDNLLNPILLESGKPAVDRFLDLLENINYNNSDLNEETNFKRVIRILGLMHDTRALKPLLKISLKNKNRKLDNFWSPISYAYANLYLGDPDSFRSVYANCTEEEKSDIKKALNVLVKNAQLDIADGSVSFDKELSVLDDAYLVRHDPDLEKHVKESLDLIANEGKAGVNVLMDKLFKDMQVNFGPNGNELIVSFGGDTAWNEWLKKREIVRSLARANAKSAIDELASLTTAKCQYEQFYEILQAAIFEAREKISNNSS